MKILITGAGGFIGKYLVRTLLDEGHEIFVLTRDAARYRCVGDETVLCADLDKIEGVAEKIRPYRLDVLVHLAWVGLTDYSYENSTRSLTQSMQLTEVCAACKIPHLVMTGTCYEYASPEGKISTGHAVDNTNYYKIAKNALRDFASLYCKEHGMRFHWMRLFYVYGPGQRENSLIPTVAGALRTGRVPEIKAPLNRNDFVYVQDVADAIAKVIRDCPAKEVLNVGSGSSVRVKDIVEEAARLLGKECTLPETQETPVTDFWADKEEMLADYGWQARYDIAQGIKEMIG